jgi:hypothetical protein
MDTSQDAGERAFVRHGVRRDVPYQEPSLRGRSSKLLALELQVSKYTEIFDRPRVFAREQVGWQMLTLRAGALAARSRPPAAEVERRLLGAGFERSLSESGGAVAGAKASQAATIDSKHSYVYGGEGRETPRRRSILS